MATLTAPLLRHLYGVLGLLCGLGVAFAWLRFWPQQAPLASLLALGYASVGLLCGLGWRGPARRTQALLAPSMLAGLAAMLAAALGSGWGLLTPGLVFVGPAVLAVHLAGTPGLGWATTAAALALMAGLGLAEHQGWLGLAAAAGTPPLGSRLVLQAAGIAVGTLMGRTMAGLLRQHLGATQAREQRFLALLGMATSAYWETDASGRLTQLSRRDAQGHFAALPEAAGRALWAADLLQFDAAAARQLHDNLARRAPLVDLPMQWRHADGSLRPGLLSGEPRWAADGQLTSYWGVARDISAEQQARLALASSESLLSQVVALAPDIITLTELASGRYVMVNDSFCRLLGHQRAQAVGHTAAELGLWRDPADHARLLEVIVQRGMAQTQLVSFNTCQGHALPLLISGVRFDSGGQSYLLLNGRDLTEANRVQQEREAILANASVGIAFTRDLRFVLANARFEAMYGWPAGALAGQPLQSLWNDPAQFQTLSQEIGPALARGESIDIERQGRRRDGSPFRVRLRAQAIDPRLPATSGTVWITEDVTRAHQAEQELARARDAAEAANRAKSAFLANTSHEIRTPLNGVLGLARLARQPGLAADRRQAYLDQIAESAEVLASIISDILDVAKIEAGKLQLESAAFDLSALLASLARVYGALAAGQSLGFALQVDPGLPSWVLGDGLRLRQILANFLQNALKFCASGSVRLVARAEPGGWLRFEVHDSGPGIPPEIQARLFEPFTQADESTTRRFGGTGLGLSICRELATLMGGEVGLHSQIGVGSCFHAQLPLPATAAPGPAPAGANQADRLQGARVLLVEDNPVNMMIGVALLELWGVQVSQAGDGPAALRAVDQATAAGQPLQAVLMDLQMPGMSGHEAAQALRQRHPAHSLPVIALTAAAMVSERERALAHGMTDFLTKPIDPQRLQEALLRALSDQAA